MDDTDRTFDAGTEMFTDADRHDGAEAQRADESELEAGGDVWERDG